MSTTITLSPGFITQKRSHELTLNLSEIFRSQTFKLFTEALTLLSLISAAVIWVIALPAI